MLAENYYFFINKNFYNFNIFHGYFSLFFPITILTLTTPGLIFHNSSEWLLLEINEYNCRPNAKAVFTGL